MFILRLRATVTKMSETDRKIELIEQICGHIFSIEKSFWYEERLELKDDSEGIFICLSHIVCKIVPPFHSVSLLGFRCLVAFVKYWLDGVHKVLSWRQEDLLRSSGTTVQGCADLGSVPLFVSKNVNWTSGAKSWVESSAFAWGSFYCCYKAM